MPRAPIALIILGALTFNFMTGFHDAANAIATSVLTRALAIPTAIALAAVLNLAGAMVNESVATTIGKGIIDSSFVTEQVVLAALVGKPPNQQGPQGVIEFDSPYHRRADALPL